MTPAPLPPLTRRRAAALGGAALALPFLARPSRAAPTRWTLYTVRFRGSPEVQVWQRMADRVKAASSGALEIAVVPAGWLGIDANAISAAVTEGRIALGEDSFYQQLIVAGGVARLPLLIQGRDAFARASRPIRSYLVQAYAARGCVVLGYTFGPELRPWSIHPFDSFAGLANRRIRYVSPEQAEFIRRLGAVPVSAPRADMPRALKSGDIDTVFATAADDAMAWRAFLKRGYAVGPDHRDAVLVANKSAFAALPAALQEIVQRECAAAEAEMIEGAFARDAEALQRLALNGIDVAEKQSDDVKTMTTRMTPMWSEWSRVRGQASVDLLFAVRRAIEQG